MTTQIKKTYVNPLEIKEKAFFHSENSSIHSRIDKTGKKLLCIKFPAIVSSKNIRKTKNDYRGAVTAFDLLRDISL